VQPVRKVRLGSPVLLARLALRDLRVRRSDWADWPYRTGWCDGCNGTCGSRRFDWVDWAHRTGGCNPARQGHKARLAQQVQPERRVLKVFKVRQARRL